VRGSGKSTFVEQQFKPKSCIWIDLLDPEEEELYIRNPKILEDKIATEKPEWVVIDEVQRVPKLLNIAHRLIEKKKQKFILLGSSARKLKRGFSNLLAGRAFLHDFFPLTSLELKNSFSLDDVLNWGSLPNLYSLPSQLEKTRYLRSYVQTFVKEEIQQEQIVRKLEPFRLFLEIAAQCSGKIINSSKISKEAGIDIKTVQSYYDILESTYIGFYLPAYHKSIRKSQTQKPKFYLFDNGVKRALDRTLDSRLVPKTSVYGEMFEHWVIQEVFRLNSYFEKDFRLSYFKNTNGLEIDLILNKGNRTHLIEIKSSDVIDESEIKKIASLKESFDSQTTAYYLSQSKLRVDICGVECWNYLEWIQSFFKN
jgi:predicted AAA+ superfamily ATPase